MTALAERTYESVEPQTPREARDERLARQIRASIYAGEYPPGSRLPATAVIAAQQGMSTGMAQRAFDMLAREGLVRTAQGSGTFVCDRHTYRAIVAGVPEGRLPGVRAVADAGRSDPAVTGLTVTDEGGVRRWRMTVEAADVAPAAAVAVAVARAAGASGRLAVAVEPTSD